MNIAFDKDDAYHFWQVSIINRIEKKREVNYIVIDKGNKKGMRSVNKPFEKIEWGEYLVPDSTVIFIPNKLGDEINDRVCADRAAGRGTEFILDIEQVDEDDNLNRATDVSFKVDEIPLEA